MATAIATPLLRFALEKAAGAAVSKLFEKGLNYLNGGSDADKIQCGISEVFREVQQVKLAIDSMSKRLDEGILRLRKDHLNGPLNDIESCYSTVQDCIDTAFKLKNEIKDKNELEKALGRLQDRLNSKLKLAANTIPGHLARVDAFLQEPEFLNSAASIALNSSQDFLTYYMKMKILFTAYWLITIKGLTLLLMAQLVPAVEFEEAPLTIKRLSAKVAEEERAFCNVVGNYTVKLAEFILASPNTRRPIVWLSGWGDNIECVMREYVPLVHNNVPRIRNEGGKHVYLLEVTTDVSKDNFDVTKNYPMRIWADQGVDHIERSDERLPIYMSNYKPHDSGWYIKPIEVGSDRYRLMAADGRWANSVLVTGWNENRLEFRYNIDVKSGFDGRPDRGYFGLVPCV
ncbi:hypothetical protein B0T14DRAFT_201819 [Immersiella caudata]|uniref:Uncharacterized protein n=1 Tax=Immersiella caudata TaxID=314043 RepID=A0AA39WPH3_9PEZI|nr:hypothetical protein B0T14DRAFT_201819 [Immersiella caudata]